MVMSGQAFPHTFAVVKPQESGPAQVPQEDTVRLVPQLSAAVTDPQFLALRVQNAPFASGAQPQTPAMAGMPAPQLCGAVQVPQEIVRGTPQLSRTPLTAQF